MGKKQKITENEIILAFLQAELDSSRFQTAIIEQLSKLGINKKVITHPNLTNENENNIRKSILKLYRDYGNNKELFEGFPENIEWFNQKIEGSLQNPAQSEPKAS